MHKNVDDQSGPTNQFNRFTQSCDQFKQTIQKTCQKIVFIDNDCFYCFSDTNSGCNNIWSQQQWPTCYCTHYMCSGTAKNHNWKLFFHGDQNPIRDLELAWKGPIEAFHHYSSQLSLIKWEKLMVELASMVMNITGMQRIQCKHTRSNWWSQKSSFCMKITSISLKQFVTPNETSSWPKQKSSCPRENSSFSHSVSIKPYNFSLRFWTVLALFLEWHFYLKNRYRYCVILYTILFQFQIGVWQNSYPYSTLYSPIPSLNSWKVHLHAIISIGFARMKMYVHGCCAGFAVQVCYIVIIKS